jgi:hypothetical protein
MRRFSSRSRFWTATCLLGTLFTGVAAARAEDSWDAIYIGGRKVGHNHITVKPVTSPQTGRKFNRVQVNTVLSFRRNADRVQMEMRYGVIETPEGSVLRLDTRTLTAQEEIRVAGDVKEGVMHLKMEAGGHVNEVNLPWGEDVRGPYGAEQSLAHKPMEPGEKRDIKIYVPDLNKICTTHLEAKQQEKLLLGGNEERTLLRIEQTFDDPNGKLMPELTSTLWSDKGGQILKTHSALMGGMDQYRTTRAHALAPDDEFDLIKATIIKTTRRIPNAERTRDVIYQLTVTEGDAKETVPTDQRQFFHPGGTSSVAMLEVRSDKKDTGQPAKEQPDPTALQPNALVNSDDPVVIEHARQAVGNIQDPWAKAVAIEAWVFKNMKRKNFSNAFAPAREVARNLEGDCTEHGVLTAAMCRAAGIPARCVVGFVYAEPLGGFGPHMWNEVFVNGRWVAIDAAYNQSEVDATHIKLAQSSLDGLSPFEPMMPVLRLHGKLKIEAREIR